MLLLLFCFIALPAISRLVAEVNGEVTAERVVKVM